jgi:DNA-binding PadR family transcriptional regulator
MTRHDRDVRRLVKLGQAFAQLPEWTTVYDLWKASGVRLGRLYPMLHRLEDEGSVESDIREDEGTGKERRFYRWLGTW